MSLIAFGLRAEFEDAYKAGAYGASIAVLDGRTLDVAELLGSGDGRIVLDDADVELVAALDTAPSLKRVSAGDAGRATIRRYDLLDSDGVRAEAQRRNIGRAGAGKVDDVRAALVAHDAAAEAGDLAAARNIAVGDPDPDPASAPDLSTTPPPAAVTPDPAPRGRRRPTGQEA